MGSKKLGFKLGVAGIFLIAGCVKQPGGPPAPAPPVVAGIDAGVCVLDTYSSTAACRSTATAVQCTSAIVASCGVEAAQIQHLLASEKRARLADGTAQ